MSKNFEITYEQALQATQGKKLDELTKDEFFDRYFAYGTEEEINNPEIQLQFVKRGFTSLLVDDFVTLIKDKKVEKSILQTDINKSIDIKFERGSISNIEIKKEFDDFILIIEFESKKEKIKHKFNEQYFVDNISLEKYIKEIEPYKNDIVAVIEEDNLLLCFWKFYDDIEYKFIN